MKIKLVIISITLLIFGCANCMESESKDQKNKPHYQMRGQGTAQTPLGTLEGEGTYSSDNLDRLTAFENAKANRTYQQHSYMFTYHSMFKDYETCLQNQSYRGLIEDPCLEMKEMLKQSREAFNQSK